MRTSSDFRPSPNIGQLVLFFGALTGCAPLSRMPPAYFAETAPALGRGQVAVTAVGGAGVDNSNGGGAGGGARVRVGIGGKQEMRVEGSAIKLWQSIYRGFYEHAGQVRSSSFSGKLSWKIAPNPHLAVIVGAGAAYAAHGTGYTVRPGGDAAYFRGAAVSPDIALLGTFGREDRIAGYGGIHLGLSIPVYDPLGTSGGVGGALTWTMGVAVRLSPWARLYAEAGPNITFTRKSSPTSSGDVPGSGLYGGVGLSATFGGSAH